jgi:hypothetical protein
MKNIQLTRETWDKFKKAYRELEYEIERLNDAQ